MLQCPDVIQKKTKLTNVMGTKEKFIRYLITGHIKMKICHIQVVKMTNE